MFCNQCGAENRNDRKFCANCGAPLHDYTKPKENLIMPEEVENAQNVVIARNKVKKITNIIMFVFFALAVALTIGSFFVDGVAFWLVIGFSFAFYIFILITLFVRIKMLKNLKK